MTRHTRLPDGSYSPFTPDELADVQKMTSGSSTTGDTVAEGVVPEWVRNELRALYRNHVSMHTLRVMYGLDEWVIRKALGMTDWEKYRYGGLD